MGIFEVMVVGATGLCSLVAGFLFGFAVVAMPGLGRLGDGAFLRAFQVMDRVIQDNQPVFMVVWVGSVLSLLGAAMLGAGQLEGVEQGLLVGAAVLYAVGVQGPTALVNVPLNNGVQALDVEAMDAAGLEGARGAFEARWNRWNGARTVVACVVSGMLCVLLFLL